MHITSVTRLRLDTMYYTTDWNAQYRRMQDNCWLMTLPFDVDHTSCHAPHSEIKMYLQTVKLWPQWLPCFSSLYSIHTDAFKPIYIPYKIFSGMLLILLPLRVLQKFHYNYHGDCRILANGMQICHLEHCYHLPSILSRRPQPDYPRHSLRMHLHHLLLDTYQPHTMSTIWRCFIWMFCHCIKCHIHPAVIISRWGLRERF